MAQKTPTNEQIAQAALELIDRDGIEAFSMRRLSAFSGVPTMTISNRFGSKDALLKAALQIMLSRNEIKAIPHEPWDHSLRRVARANRAMALTHPNAFMLFVRTPAFESPVLEFTQSVFATHEQLPDNLSRDFLSLMHAFLTGFQLSEMYANQRKEADRMVCDVGGSPSADKGAATKGADANCDGGNGDSDSTANADLNRTASQAGTEKLPAHAETAQSDLEKLSQQVADLFDEEMFEKNLDVIIAGFAARYNLPLSE